MLPRPRPDLVDAWVELWLSTAVGLAAAMTAPLKAFRAPLSETGEGEVYVAPPEGEEAEAAPDVSTVSPVRPADVSAAPGVGLAASETCGNCRHFHRVNSQAGECRHDPPGYGTMALPSDRRRGEWPITLESEWCGRFYKAHVPGLTREDLDALH